MPTPRQYANRADRQKAYRDRQKQARAAEQSAKGLPSLPAISTMPGTARWRSLIEAAHLQLETAWSEMVDYEEERSDAWKDSDKAVEHTERMNSIETALSELDEIVF